MGVSNHAVGRRTWSERSRAPACAAPVRADEVTGSTNATALAMAEEGAPEWTLVAAGHQTAGRGRLGRTWEDRPGSALMFSFVLRPRLEPRPAGLLTLLAGAAMARGLEVAGADARAASGRTTCMTPDGKAGGILAESACRRRRGSARRHRRRREPRRPPAGVPGAAALGGVEAEDRCSRRSFRGFAARYRPGEPGFAAEVVADARAVSLTLGTDVAAARAGGGAVVGPGRRPGRGGRPGRRHRRAS